MMKLCATVPLFLFADLIGAQNLVVNPGFEDCTVLDSADDQFRIIDANDLDLAGWSMPTLGTSDHYYFADSLSGNAQNGQPAPCTGHCYAGFIAFSGYYEYLGGRLSEPLKPGVTYTVSFALGTQFNRDFTEKRIGVCFSSESRTSGGMGLLDCDPQITLDTVKDRSIKDDWLIYRTTYTASGGETVITIGEFIEYGKFISTSGIESTYFYVDDVFVGTAAPTTVTQDAMTIAPGKTLTLQNIYFETGKSRILPESYTALDDVIAQLKKQPNLNVEIIGHTDKHGDKTANQKLSEDRAKAVADYFIANGIDAARITTSGKGSSEPISDEDSKNRRVEFIFSE